MESTIVTASATRTRAEPLVTSGTELDPATERHLWLAALAVVVAAGAVRLLMAALVPLVPDEVYYWDWSRRPATGYFDHPPLIALLIGAGRLLFGDTPLGVRFVPVLCGIAGMGLVAELAGRHGGGAAALRAAVLAALVPLSAVGLVLATPDAPLLLALAASLAAVDRAVAAPGRSLSSTGWWVIAGIAIGLGMSAKYSAALLPFGLLLAFVVSPVLRQRLATPGPYVGGAVSLLVFLPVVEWNARNEWISFAFQLNHGFGPGGGSAIGRQLELIAGQLGLMSPVLFVMIVMAVTAALGRRHEPRRFLLGMTALAMFAVFVYSGLHQRVQPNWPAPAYVPGMVLLALVAGGTRWRAWWRAGLVIAAVATVVIYVHTLRPILPLAGGDDPVAQAFGWESLAEAVTEAAATGATADGASVWVAANRYQDAAQLAFHLPDRPHVFSLNLGNRANQYDLWPGFFDTASPGDGLVLVLDSRDGPDPVIEALAPHFREVNAGPRVELRRGEVLLQVRRVWILRGWLGSRPE